MTDPTDQSRAVLPIPDRQHLGLVTYDAKDPDTEFPPITPLLPPAGAPNVLVVLLDETWDMARAVPSADQRTHRLLSDCKVMGSRTRGFTRRHCVLRPAPLF